MKFKELDVRTALEKSWSIKTAKQWSQENPANGQCNVTAAVVFDLFGGEILRTRVPGFWHYYNRIDDHRCDLTDSQFTRPGNRFPLPECYDDHLSDRGTAMDGIPQIEYDTLRTALLEELKSKSGP